MPPAQTHAATRAEMANAAVKAVTRIADRWRLTIDEAAGLADVSASTWKRAKGTGRLEMSHDRLLRMSALVGIYKALGIYFNDPLASEWMTRPNTGPLFDGKRPVDTLIAGGLPAFSRVRNHLDALRGGV